MSDRKAATEEELQELHRAVASALLQALNEESCEACKRSAVAPAMLKCAIAFLSNNGIHLDVAAIRDVRTSLREMTGLSLPFTPRK